MQPKKPAAKRLAKEIEGWSKDPPNHCMLLSTNDERWLVEYKGEAGTLYEGATYQIQLTIPDTYPFKPPKIQFVTPIYHCNVSESGSMTLEITQDLWNPAITLKKVIEEVCALIANPDPDHPQRPDLAELMKRDPDKYEQNVREYFFRYHMA